MWTNFLECHNLPYSKPRRPCRGLCHVVPLSRMELPSFFDIIYNDPGKPHLRYHSKSTNQVAIEAP
jgi:hypothetical protein